MTSLPNPCLGTATSPGAPERQLLTASVQSWEPHRLGPQATPKPAAPLGRVGEGLLGNASPLQGSQVQRPERPDRGGPSLSRHTSLLLSPPQALALAVSPHPPLEPSSPDSHKTCLHIKCLPLSPQRGHQPGWPPLLHFCLPSPISWSLRVPAQGLNTWKEGLQKRRGRGLESRQRTGTPDAPAPGTLSSEAGVASAAPVI